METNIFADLPHHKGQARYSLLRAIRSAIGGQDRKPAGLEGEVSQEIAHRSGRSPAGFYLPHDAQVQVPVEHRADLMSGVASPPIVWPPYLFIDVLRAKLIVEKLGGTITTLSTDRGEVQVPVQTGATPVAWVAENASYGSFTGLTTSSITFIPHTVLANTGISRIMKDKAAPGFEAWVYADLAKSIAVAIDAAALSGGGTNQPNGILALTPATLPGYTLAADTGNGGAPAYADLVAMEALLTNANGDAPAEARLAWATTPNGRSKLRRTDASSANAGQFLWSKDFNTVLGYPAVATTNLPNNSAKGSGTNLSAIILGNWADAVVNLFSAVDVLVNPYTLTTTGYYQVSAYQEADVQFKRASSFVTAEYCVTT